MSCLLRPAALLAALAAFAPAGHAQVSPTQSGSRGAEAMYRIRRTDEAIRLDARLAEAVWKDADSIVNFRQREPLEGELASERTVVTIVRNADHLFVAVRAYDREMSGVRSTQLRRDAD